MNKQSTSNLDVASLLQTIRDGGDLTGKDGVLTPLIKQISLKQARTSGFQACLNSGYGKPATNDRVNVWLDSQ
ncbi:MAG: hypothetical protein CSA50_06040 [Gammaproteobacteria bacterium]|nr:MAG: hypothetical protein CSA50_06040 [Gammaproteobacteria bacterium]